MKTISLYNGKTKVGVLKIPDSTHMTIEGDNLLGYKLLLLFDDSLKTGVIQLLHGNHNDFDSVIDEVSW